MGRPAKLYRRKQNQIYYGTVLGKQTPFGRDRKLAEGAFHAALAAASALSGNQHTITVLAVLELFLDHCQRKREGSTFEFYAKRIRPWAKWLTAKGLSKLRVVELKPYLLTEYVDERFEAEQLTSIRNCIRACQRPFFWAEEEGRIERNPLRAVAKPALQTRDVYMSQEQWQAVLKACPNEPIKDLLCFLRYTGCRPFEVRQIEAKHVDRKNRCIVFPKEISKGRKFQRVILLSHDTAFEIVQRLLLKTPDGHIFRNCEGNPWTEVAVESTLYRMQKELGFKTSPIVFRHAFCTDMLVAGMDPIELSEIMGHRDLTMIKRVYNHLKLKRPHLHKRLRAAFDRAAAPEDGEPMAGQAVSA